MAESTYAKPPFSVEGTSTTVVAEPVVMRRLKIENIGCATSTDAIVSVLGLSGTPFLNNNCSVELHDDGKGKYHAIAHVPHLVANELLRGGPWELHGRALTLRLLNGDPTTPPRSTLTAPQQPPPPPIKKPAVEIQTSSEASTAEETGENEETSELFLQLSTLSRPFRLPTKVDVAQAIFDHFKQEGILCIPVRKRPEVIYKFIFREPVKAKGHEIEFECSNMKLKFPMYTWKKPEDAPQQGKREGTLLTFFQARRNKAGQIPPRCFDEKLKELNFETIIPTRDQNIRFTRVLNGNRYTVIETPEDLKTIPEWLSVTHPSTNETVQVGINYKGQERYCNYCDENHVGRCPRLQAIFEAKRAREEMRKAAGITAKIYSDSTLRFADQLGLRADVCAMSGGGIGQVVQASLDDPETIDKNTIVIVAGTNDMKVRNFPSNTEYARNVDISLTKLAEAATADPDKKIRLVKQHPMLEGEVPADTRIRELYLHGRLDELAALKPNIEVIPVHYEVDDTGHPTDEGTYHILTTLSDSQLTTEPLIWNEEHVISDRVYAGVEDIFRYGCNGCHKFGAQIDRSKHSNQLLCDECYDKVLVACTTENSLLNDVTVRVAATYSITPFGDNLDDRE